VEDAGEAGEKETYPLLDEHVLYNAIPDISRVPKQTNWPTN
jgi:hypothetical protein